MTEGICKHCYRPWSEHCQSCGACPINECPYWCADNDDPYEDHATRVRRQGRRK